MHSLFLLLSLLRFLSAQPPKNAIFTQIFSSSYDTDTRPYFNQTLLEITTQFRLNLLFSVNTKDLTYNLDLFVVESWLDPRLAFPQPLWDVNVNGPLRLPLNKVWKPDTFFYNAISCTTSDQLLTLNYDGRLTWTRHQTCTFHADFDLRQFPFDTQNFDLRRLSFAYNSNELLLTTPTNKCFNPNPLQNFDNSLWQLQSLDCFSNFYGFRNGVPSFSQLVVNLHFQRLSANYIVKNIAPMFVIVFLSTLTYWIDPTSPPARVAGTVTLVLSIVTFNLVVSSDLPKINYSTLLDFYVWKCFMFCAFAVAEFALVNYLLVNKIVESRIALLADDFCRYTIPILWFLSNLIYWTLMNPILDWMLGLIEIGYFVGNIVRIWWNWKNNQKGMKPAITRLIEKIKGVDREQLQRLVE